MVLRYTLTQVALEALNNELIAIESEIGGAKKIVVRSARRDALSKIEKRLYQMKERNNAFHKADLHDEMLDVEEIRRLHSENGDRIVELLRVESEALMSALDRQASADELERRQRELDEHSEIIRKKEEDQKQYPVPTYLKKALESGNVNVAITGASGAGKSSLSNVIRGTTNSKNPNHAKTGIKESTVEPTQYEYTAQLGRVLENFGRYITDVFNAK